MASIRQLKSGKWNVQVRLKGQTAKSSSFATREEAEQWAIRMEEEAKAPLVHTLSSVGSLYCEDRLRGKPSYRNGVRIVRQLGVAFPQPLQEITPKQANEYKLKRLRQVKPSSCRQELSFMSRLFRYAQRDMLLEEGKGLPLTNPVERIALPRESRPSDKVVSREELDRLLGKLSPLMALVVELAYETAMRRSEIVKLTPSCVHLDERIADVVDGKNGTRSVPLTKRAVELLREALARSPQGKLFKVLPNSVSVAVKRAREEAGLGDDVRLHQLRHTRITNVAKKGFNNAQIMMVSGHRDVRSVARYSHLNARDVLPLID
ncbi:tyrosine-type recombinase/integrase [Pistricoccus aurantiacus]|uniref:tyrosine-type recombinase/integrase n=1 Tax=Pistricoccus aurantiacus TaxID=1883414 RepID=UPI00363CB403